MDIGIVLTRQIQLWLDKICSSSIPSSLICTYFCYNYLDCSGL